MFLFWILRILFVFLLTTPSLAEAEVVVMKKKAPLIERTMRWYFASTDVKVSRNLSGTKVYRVVAVKSENTTSWLPSNGKLTSTFGYRKRPRRAFHSGIDIAAKTGSLIFSAGTGTVIAVERRSGYGKMITIRHSNGLLTRYAHCSSISAKVGERVKHGQVIAKIGRTGYTTGAHLHFEVLKGGRCIDPIPILRHRSLY